MAVSAPRRVKSQETRKKIFDAAASLMKEYGEDYLTIANICDRAGLSKGTFFYHFKSKDDLLQYYLREGLDDFVASKGKEEPVSDDIYLQLVALYEDYVTYCTDTGIDFVASYYTPKNKALNVRDTMATPDTMNTLLKASVDDFKVAQEAGYVRKDWSALDMSFDCCSIIKGVVFEWSNSDGAIDPIAHMKHMLHVYFNSVITEKYKKEFIHEEPPIA